MSHRSIIAAARGLTNRSLRALVMSAVLVASCGAPQSRAAPVAVAPADANPLREVAALQSAIAATGFEGVFVYYDPADAVMLVSSAAEARRATLPASTFKIVNTLIALETGVADGPEFVLPWDGVERAYDVWNQDHTLRSAFAASVVWYYQELARRIGVERMQFFVSQLDYGNASIEGGIDMFWLNGGIRISPIEQVEMLHNLATGAHPFSAEHVRLLDDIMVLEVANGITLRGKTGWVMRGDPADPDFGWLVGSVERDSADGVERAYFATRLHAADPDPAVFGPARHAATRNALNALGWPLPR